MPLWQPPKSNFRTRVVTLAGDVVNAGGSLTGGSRQQKEAGFLSRGKEIDEQEQKAGVLRRELLGYQELLEEHEGTLKVYNNKLVELRQDLQQKEIRKAELGVALERLSAEQRQAAERLELLLDDRNQVSGIYGSSPAAYRPAPAANGSGSRRRTGQTAAG